MKNPEYMKIKLKYFPPDIISMYNLHDKVHSDGYVYIKIKKGMYGLKQAAILAYEQLVTNLKQHGYRPLPHTTGMWEHVTRPTKFCLCVDDFGIKYFCKDDADHLLNALRQHYEITTDWKGKNYCGLTFHWNYIEQYVDVSMPGYIEKIKHKYFGNHVFTPTNTPFKFSTPTYTSSAQYTPAPDISPKLDAKTTTRVQAILGSLLYYARAIEHTMLPALNELSTEQASPTNKTLKKLEHLVEYVVTHPDATIRYRASNMVMNVDSDAAYLVLPKAKSRIAGYCYFSEANGTKYNAPFLLLCKTLKHVVTSTAEAETGGLFSQCTGNNVHQTYLTWPWTPTPIHTTQNRQLYKSWFCP